ncbi:lipopolysaccharide biosynthesis protein [Paraburkholderia fungorum]|uniref:lipopolysaccharide biosynthesis protein n=1 Tax=Paraburkholderia fungorum TaxID=134537 RepID=UPI00209202C7|nr:translocase [Paraburkholderia fungorum]USU20969.1 translocase [Paraburkholderia fungorum]USU27035.1 translocase [Paraburkholderia fungorum]
MIKLKDSAISLVGVMAGQVTFFACVTLLGRQYGPSSLGHFNALLAIGTLAGTLLAVRYELACVSDNAAMSFDALVHVFAVASVTTIVGATAVVLWGHAEYWNVCLFAIGYFIQMMVGHYFNSLRRYALIALSRVLVNPVFAVYLSFAQHLHGGFDVFSGYAILNAVAAVCFLGAVFFHGAKRGYLRRPRLEFFREHARYAKFILPSTLCSSVLLYSLSIAIPAWYSTEQAGYFAAAYRFGFFPVSLIGQSIGGVFRRDAIQAVSESQQTAALKHVFAFYGRWLLVIASCYAVLGSLLFGSVINIVFGGKWNGAVAFFYAMLPLFVVQTIYVPLSQIFLVTRKQFLDFVIQLGLAVSLLSTLLLVHLLKMPVQKAVFYFSTVASAGSVVAVILVVRAAGFEINRAHIFRLLGGVRGERGVTRLRLPRTVGEGKINE